MHIPLRACTARAYHRLLYNRRSKEDGVIWRLERRYRCCNRRATRQGRQRYQTDLTRVTKC